MGKATIVIKNLDEVVNLLKSLDPKVAKPAMRKAMRKGCKVFQKQAQSLCPVRTGALRDSLVVRAGKRSRRFFSVNVTTGNDKDRQFSGETFYGAFVEMGTSKRPATPFLRPAFDEKQAQVQDIVRNELANALNGVKGK